MDSFYAIARNTCLSLAAAAAVIAGLRLFQKWNRGEEVEGMIFIWLIGILFAGGIVVMVDNFIVGGAYVFFTGISGTAEGLSIEIYQASLLLGIVITIVGVIKIYRKFQNGEEDIYEYMLKWFGSLLFLFSMGYLISAIL
ncbi:MULTISPECIES: DUF4134 family protein [Runella]|uniref:DUF4134 domain-containing protein n=1 Tax=Runella slithyformis (strain ATCC 29530 / DSM 19594 / LMG 11500 / NCIMB 11436 / LSU 4) TaxID=761193 RepID=A0A7U3ZRI5_RUNSL|nr:MULTISPECIES: DUF4134 family protein [Runella]AEI52027.1 hypothetical protein Runsl_5890 [Runella slithyformis DSM 19594]MCA0233174.1 DUF4134 domain-containing protein [Bacteroidota bacterium]MDF7821182.1 DUF4134 family protein [Runella sp. MFBS21]